MPQYIVKWRLILQLPPQERMTPQLYLLSEVQNSSLAC